VFYEQGVFRDTRFSFEIIWWRYEAGEVVIDWLRCDTKIFTLGTGTLDGAEGDCATIRGRGVFRDARIDLEIN
jgi:hypothetical protein